ncbi:LysR family transcriptional regulator [Serratia grimesii]|uniref:LysR family transcriptional regulator n=1 Tax=Serratia grimesii TaxID=82995 RepID=UPI00077CD257|nr:LysR family transcriptional regulator [Serratia grimesii]CAI0911943.1 D-malate degradation protein R [Serratia grimesii]CAI2412386.1 D-malate degradation protein R [Serratia grimesii]SUI35317.1 D-malate degradation protein R [Serratia grimesii]
MHDNFAAIPIFVAVVECESFSAAARRLGITKSAVSKRIAQLESSLGVQLLQRTTRSLSLTEAGEQYFGYARNACAVAQEGEDVVTRLQGQPQGCLRISVPMVFGRLHVAPLIPHFLAACPDMEINMMMDDQVVDLVDGGFDLAIRIGQLADSSLIARRIAPCRSVLCAAPAYLARSGTPTDLEQLAQHNCLFYSYFRGGSEWQFEGPAGAVRFQPRGNYQVNNSEALREALIAGLGICQMPTFIVGDDIAQGRLIELMPAYRLPEHAIYAVYPQRKYLPAKVLAFVDFLLAQLGGEQPYWDIPLQR